MEPVIHSGIPRGEKAPDPGFSLIELLVAMALGLLVLTGLSSTFLMQNKTYDVQQQINEMMQTTRAALDMIGREVRMAGYDPARGGVTGIVYDTSKLRINADLNGDGDTGETNERIWYTYDSSNKRIIRRKGDVDDEFANDITSFSYAFLDQNGAATTNSANIRQVRISITARTAKPDFQYPQNNGYRTRTLTMVVTPPNLAKK
ncbi:MAG: prepilin-type N-terminal cleavage/methylation domain-containing protein [Thermodesulfobacteriota bacterium]